MGHLADGLLKDQTAFGFKAVRPAAEDVSGELDVVSRGIVASQAHPKAVLAARGAVAGPGIAAAHVKGADYIMAKTGLLTPVELLHADRHVRRLSTRLDDKYRCSILSGTD